MEITLSIGLIGLATAILTELIKVFPKIGGNDLWKSLTAIVVLAVATFLFNAYAWSWTYFFTVMVFAFTNYKMIVQPAAKAIGMASQKE